jgi:hypothetical protein
LFSSGSHVHDFFVDIEKGPAFFNIIGSSVQNASLRPAPAAGPEGMGMGRLSFDGLGGSIFVFLRESCSRIFVDIEKGPAFFNIIGSSVQNASLRPAPAAGPEGMRMGRLSFDGLGGVYKKRPVTNRSSKPAHAP